MIVPYEQLSPAALTAVIEEYVTRDGTELTDASAKALQVREALGRGELVLVFDADTETCNFLPRDSVPPDDPAPEQE